MAATKRRTQGERRASTRARLLDSAARLIARRGYRGASLDAVAEAAGLSKGALTYNFASKADLLLTLSADRIARRRQRLVELTPRIDVSDPESAARAIVAALPWDREWGLLFLEFVCEGARDRRFRRGLTRELEPGRVEATEAVEALGLGSGHEARELAEGLSALSNGVSIEALLDGDATRATALYERMLALLLKGLRAERERPARGKDQPGS